MKTTITPLFYHPNPLPQYAEQLSQPHSFALTGGRYTILGWDPLEVITADHEDPFTYMQERMKDFQSDISPCGGWYGYLGYELGESFHQHLEPRERDLPLPDLCMGLYDEVVVFDHEKKVGYVWSLNSSLRGECPWTSSLRGECPRTSSLRGECPRTSSLRGECPRTSSLRGECPRTSSLRGECPRTSSLRGECPRTSSLRGGAADEAIQKNSSLRAEGEAIQGKGLDCFVGVPPRNDEIPAITKFVSNFTPESYKTAFDQIQTALRRGDCYQVNLAQRFTADFEGNSWDLFIALMQNNPAPFAAYLRLPESTIISCSPERFIRIDNGIIESKPIKGTCAREEDPEQLKKCEKNCAENLMIVDLMRNDLGKICKTGTVNVTDLFSIESYRSVHHLVSTIIGQIEDHISPFQALISCFPGGSITGAPKLASMQQIRALEPHARHIYCGSIGYCDFTGVLDMNIAIRTAVVTQGKCHVWAGGGIVLDSSWEDEYQECMHKIRPFLALPI